MVSTRRSSRLQEKQGSASVPASPTPSATQSPPSTRRARSATKATPPSATRARKSPSTKAAAGSGTRRGRPRKSTGAENDDALATQSDTASEQQESGSAGDEDESAVKKQLFHENGTPSKDDESEPEPMEQVDETVEVAAPSEEPVVSELAPVVEVEEGSELEKKKVALQNSGDKAVEEQPATEQAKVDEEEEEEEEIVLMDSSDDEEEEERATETANMKASSLEIEEQEEEDDGDDIDIAEFAKMAATGISLLTFTKAPATGSATSKNIPLVPDSLNSGASSRTKYLEFEASKLGLGAKIVPQTAAVEEQKVLAQQLGKIEKANRQRTEAQDVSNAGRKWFDMSSHDMDADARRDFALLKMRNYLDPKKFYKTSDHTKKMPKHFQFGTVIEGAHEFKSARLTKKERKQTFTEEIMADEGIRKYTKRVFLQVQDKRAGHGKKKKQKRF